MPPPKHKNRNGQSLTAAPHTHTRTHTHTHAGFDPPPQAADTEGEEGIRPPDAPPPHRIFNQSKGFFCTSAIPPPLPSKHCAYWGPKFGGGREREKKTVKSFVCKSTAPLPVGPWYLTQTVAGEENPAWGEERAGKLRVPTVSDAICAKGAAESGPGTVGARAPALLHLASNMHRGQDSASFDP